MSSNVDLYTRNMAINDYDNIDAGTFQLQALEVRLPGADFDPEAVPTTGEEFLTYMVYERKNTPAVVTCRPKVEKKPADKPDNIMTFQPHEFSDTYDMLPTNKWKEQQMNCFENVRKGINSARDTFKVVENMELPSYDNTFAWLEYCRQHQPLLNVMLNLGQRDLESLLEIICEWLRMGESPHLNCDDRMDEQQETTIEYDTSELTILTKWLGQWLYGILACLRIPLEPEVHSTLREIARICLRKRSSLKMPGEAKFALTYNIFIHLIAKYFGQLDFDQYI